MSGLSSNISGPPTGEVARMRPVPLGFIWDSTHHSCGYDAMFTVLLNVWLDDPRKWQGAFEGVGPCMAMLATELRLASANSQTLEHSRNTVRRHLNTLRPEYFPYGPNTTSIDKLAEYMFPSKAFATGRQTCSTCTYRDPELFGMLEIFMSAGLSRQAERGDPVPISVWLQQYLKRGRTTCRPCRNAGRRGRVFMTTTVPSAPPFMMIMLDSRRLVFDNAIVLETLQGQKRFALSGIIYGGGAHFTCRIVRDDGWIWYHDGIPTGRNCIREFEYNSLVDGLELQECRGRRAISVVYALE
ncbi:hypothetical protein C8R47DRAFT_1079752 [Mycena vitilis]|nr:hypothetical protein C8R47DRAFT_1079752 [Mycena vitilis]